LEFVHFSDQEALTLSLLRKPGGEFLVSSIALVKTGLRNEYVFDPAKPLGCLFGKGLAECCEAHLLSLSMASNDIRVPDFFFEIPGLTLSGMLIQRTRQQDGVEEIALRFRNYIGAIKSVFLFDTAMCFTPVSVRERIAIDVLQDILTPLFDIMSLALPERRAFIQDHAPAIQQRLDQLTTKREDLLFFLGLLQRYVAGCQEDSKFGAACQPQEQELASQPA